MSGAALLACLVLGPPALLATLPPKSEEPTARVVLEPAAVAIGEPTVLALEVRHDPGRSLMTGGLDLAPGDAWVVLEGPRIATYPVGGGNGGAVTRARWRLMALEPGEWRLGGLELHLDDGTTLSVEPALLVVAGELGPGEDQPRPLPELHSIPERTGPLGPGHLFLAAGVIALAGGAWLLGRRVRRPAGPPPALDPLQRFGALRGDAGDGGGDGWDAGAVRVLMFELSALLRSAAEEGQGQDQGPSRAGLSDEEWLAALAAEERHPPAVIESLAGLLEDCARVKFGAERPTRFAVRETLDRAETVLRSMAGQERT